MQNEKLIKLLNDYIGSFNKNLAQIKVIPLIEDDHSIILDINDDIIEHIFKDDKEKIKQLKFIKFILKGNFESNLGFEITSEQNKVINELISLSKSYIEDNLYEEEMLEEAQKLLKRLTSSSITLDIYTNIDMEVINHIMAYQKLKPIEVNELLKEILLTIESFQEEFLNLDLDEPVETPRVLTLEEKTVIRNYALDIANLTPLTEEENIKLYNELNSNQNIMERTAIREKLIKGNLKLALSIFVDKFLIYYPKMNLEDILGELNIVVIEAINKYNPNETSLEKLLNKEIKEFVKNSLKRLETSLPISESEQIEEDISSTDDVELQVMEKEELECYLRQMPLIVAKVIRLRYPLDVIPKSQTETAEILGISQGYVSMLEKQGKAILNEYYNKTRSFSK